MVAAFVVALRGADVRAGGEEEEEEAAASLLLLLGLFVFQEDGAGQGGE